MNVEESKAYFHKNFGKYIRDYKFIPNVDLAVPLINNYFAFSIDMPFLVSVSTNRRSFWPAADNEDLRV
ncbi:unnamed protein product [Rhizophagus irregularis]|nr:unnamed protein product [Rhizophagus irregularis]